MIYKVAHNIVILGIQYSTNVTHYPLTLPPPHFQACKHLALGFFIFGGGGGSWVVLLLILCLELIPSGVESLGQHSHECKTCMLKSSLG